MQQPQEKNIESELLAKLKIATLNQFKAKKLACYVPMQAKIPSTNQSCDLLERLITFLNQPNQKTALLLGDAGGGKTLFGQYLIDKLWQQFNNAESTRLPLWINLKSIKNPGKNLISSHLKVLGFNERDRAKIAEYNLFFLVLDGADEIVCNQNIYEANHFVEKDVKILTTCRSSFLPINQPTRQLFAAFSGDFVEYELTPFTKEQCLGYLKLYLQHYHSHWKEDDFTKNIALIDLGELIPNPYYLYMTLKILPELVAKYKDVSDTIKRIKLTRNELYQQFIERRFVRQQTKLYQTHPTVINELLTKRNQERDKDNQFTLIDLFRQYCQKLAQAMHDHGLKCVNYPPDPLMQTIIDIDKQHGSLSKSKPVNDLSWLKEFFDEHDSYLALIRSACPIRRERSGEWSFFHISLLEYFIADHLFNSSIFDAQLMVGHNLGATNLQLEPDILQFLVDRAKKDKEFVKVLFHIIELSKYEPQAWKAAANAITILNYAGVLLAHKNFRRIRIGGVDEVTKVGWGADLSHSYLFKSDMTEADVRYVIFYQADLSGVKLNNACMTGVKLSEQPPLLGEFRGLSADGSWFVVSRHSRGIFSNNSSVLFINSENLATISELSIPKIPHLVHFNPKYQQVVLHRSGKKPYIILCEPTKNMKVEMTLSEIFCDIRFRPDGKQLVVCDKNRIVFVDTLSGKIQADVVSELKHIETLAYNNDGNVLLIVYSTGMLLIDTSSYTIKKQISAELSGAHSFWNNKLIVIPEHLFYDISGKQYIYVDYKSIRLIKLDNPVLHTVYEGLTGDLPYFYDKAKNRIVSFGPTQRILYSWNEVGGMQKRDIKTTDEILAYNFSPDCEQLAILGRKSLTLWTTNNGMCLNQAAFDFDHQVDPPKIYYSPNNTQLAIAIGNSIQLWDVSTLCCTGILGGHEKYIANSIRLVTYHPNTSQIFSDNGSRVFIWQLASYRNKTRVKKPSYLGKYIIASQNGAFIIVNNKPNFYYYDLNNQLKIKLPYVKVRAFALSQDDCRLAMLTAETLLIYDITNTKEIARFEHREFVYPYQILRYVLFRPDAQQIATCLLLKKEDQETKIIRLLNIQTKQYLDINASTEDFCFYDYNSDGTKFYYVTAKNLLVYETNKGKLLSKIPLPMLMVFLCQTPDNKKIITIHQKRSVTGCVYSFYSWDIEEGSYQVLSPLIGDRLDYASFKIHPNGKFLAVAGKLNPFNSDDYLSVWDIHAKKWLTSIELHTETFDYHWINDEMKLRIVDCYGAQTIWQVGSDVEDKVLLASTQPSYLFRKQQLEITNCYGLDDNILEMLRYTEDKNQPLPIIGEPSKTRKADEVIKSRDSQIYIKEGLVRLTGFNNEQFEIRQDFWIVSLVRKRKPNQDSNFLAENSKHVWLLIQGMTTTYYSYVKEIHFFLDESKNYYLFQSVGQGLVQIRDKSPRDLRSQAESKEFVAQSWNVSKDVVLQMMKNIEADQQEKLMYIRTGYSPGIFGRSAYSCLTWCEYHLNKIGLNVQTPKDLFCAFPSEHLPEKEVSPQQETCNTM